VRHYGQWMRDEAQRRIGHLYPRVRLPKEQGGGEATVIAWLWARTVTCPNPACGARMPLVRSFALSTKKGKEAWVEPVVDHQARTMRFEVRSGGRTPPEGTVNRKGARCLVCDTSVPFDHVRSEGRAGCMAQQLMAVVAEGQRGRAYLAATDDQTAVAEQAEPHDVPETDLPRQALGFRVQLYGMTKHRDLFTPRQLVALTTFSDLVGETRERVRADAAHLPDPDAYANAVATYLGIVASKSTDYWSNLCIWRSDPKNLGVGHVFARQAIQMIWDFAEGNPFSSSSGNWNQSLDWVVRTLDATLADGSGRGSQANATAICASSASNLISTDPPYYDNIGYADLSDFFYVWLRRSLRTIYPELFHTILVPKADELVATPYRFDGDKKKSKRFFEEGLGQAFGSMQCAQDTRYPRMLHHQVIISGIHRARLVAGAQLMTDERRANRILDTSFKVDTRLCEDWGDRLRGHVVLPHKSGSHIAFV